MTLLSRVQLRELAKARRLPLSKKLGVLNENIIERLLGFYYESRNRNMISESVVSRKERNIPIENIDYVSENYGQIYLQQLRSGGDPTNRYDYCDPVCKEIVESIESVVGAACRMRLASLKTGAEIPEHIDDPKQHRVIALLNGQHDFIQNTKMGTATVKMKIGELWYVNTAFPHRVNNTGEYERIVLLIDLLDSKLLHIDRCTEDTE